MRTPTAKIKKQVRNATRFDRGAAKSTVKDRARTPAMVGKNGEHGAISAYGTARSTIKGMPLSPAELDKIDAYWREIGRAHV